MLKKIFFIKIFFLGLCSIMVGQTTHFVLTRRKNGICPNEVNYIVLPLNISSEYIFKGLPSIEDYRIGCFDLQKEQTAYEHYLSKIELTTQEHSILKEQDTTKLSYTSTKHRIFFLTYFSKNKKITILDLNYNHDFSDDKILKFDATEKSPKKGISEFIRMDIAYEYVEDRKIVQRSLPLLIEPFNKMYTHKNYPDGRFHINAKIFEYVKGDIILNGTPCYFAACSGAGQRGVFKDFQIHFSLTPFSDSIRFRWDQMLTSKDSISIGGHTYTPRFSTFGDTFFLEPYNIKKVKFINLFDDLIKKITTDNKKIELAQIRANDLTVLDFWGTWCAPCVKDIPKLDRIYEQYKGSGVGFIGIAVDYSQEKVNEFLLSHKVRYPVIFENLNSGSDWIFKKMDISVFPTYIILNKDGKIIFNTNSIDSLYTNLSLLKKNKK